MTREAESDTGADAEETPVQTIGVFHEAEALRTGLDKLLAADFDWSYLSLLTTDKTVDDRLPDFFEEATDVEEAGGPAYKAYLTRQSYQSGRTFAVGGLAYVGAVAAGAMVVASGGAVAAGFIAAAAAGGAGAAAGEAMARFLDKQQADLLADHLAQGAILVLVRCNTPEAGERATAALADAGAAQIVAARLPNAEVSLSGGVSSELSFLNNAKVQDVLGLEETRGAASRRE